MKTRKSKKYLVVDNRLLIANGGQQNGTEIVLATNSYALANRKLWEDILNYSIARNY